MLGPVTDDQRSPWSLGDTASALTARFANRFAKPS